MLKIDGGIYPDENIEPTHTDRGHIHSHILVNTYTLTGRKLNANKTTLDRVKEYSDRVCLATLPTDVFLPARVPAPPSAQPAHQLRRPALCRNFASAFIRSSCIALVMVSVAALALRCKHS